MRAIAESVGDVDDGRLKGCRSRCRAVRMDPRDGEEAISCRCSRGDSLFMIRVIKASTRAIGS
jgi:hypothetical protein